MRHFLCGVMWTWVKFSGWKCSLLHQITVISQNNFVLICTDPWKCLGQLKSVTCLYLSVFKSCFCHSLKRLISIVLCSSQPFSTYCFLRVARLLFFKQVSVWMREWVITCEWIISSFLPQGLILWSVWVISSVLSSLSFTLFLTTAVVLLIDQKPHVDSSLW